MKTTSRNFYVAPEFMVFTIMMEQNFVASSATLNPGGPEANNYNPQVDDWLSEENQGSGIGEF